MLYVYFNIVFCIPVLSTRRAPEVLPFPRALWSHCTGDPLPSLPGILMIMIVIIIIIIIIYIIIIIVVIVVMMMTIMMLYVYIIRGHANHCGLLFQRWNNKPRELANYCRLLYRRWNTSLQYVVTPYHVKRASGQLPHGDVRIRRRGGEHVRPPRGASKPVIWV